MSGRYAGATSSTPDPHPPAQPGAARAGAPAPRGTMLCTECLPRPVDTQPQRFVRRPTSVHSITKPSVSPSPSGTLANYMLTGSCDGWRKPPPHHSEDHPSPRLQRRMVADHTGARTVQPGQGAHHALPLPGNRHPHPHSWLRQPRGRDQRNPRIRKSAKTHSPAS
jgi:hypothetical protein